MSQQILGSITMYTINKKYLSAEELKILANDPIELEPWDPMGTLA